jgi:hypothetical protein
MGKVIKLTESELISLVNKVIAEHGDFDMMPIKQQNLSKIHRKLNDRTHGETSRFDDNDDALADIAFRGEHPSGGKIGDEDEPKVMDKPKVKHKPTAPDYAEDNDDEDESPYENERGIPYPNQERKPSFKEKYQTKINKLFLGRKKMRGDEIN